MSEKKSFTVAILLSLFAGFFGVDRFYLGCTWTGILKLITLGGLGVWALIDLIRLASGSKLCGGFQWDTELKGGGKQMIGGSEVDDTMCIILAVTIGVMLLYFFVLPWIKRTYGNNSLPKKEEEEKQ
jgi:TM2 domain-containing membrane protein YozV